MNIFKYISSDIFAKILSFGNIYKLLIIRKVCKSWNQIIINFNSHQIQFIDNRFSCWNDFINYSKLNWAIKYKKYIHSDIINIEYKNIKNIGYFTLTNLFWIETDNEFSIGNFVENKWIEHKLYNNEIIILSRGKQHKFYSCKDNLREFVYLDFDTGKEVKRFKSDCIGFYCGKLFDLIIYPSSRLIIYHKNLIKICEKNLEFGSEDSIFEDLIGFITIINWNNLITININGNVSEIYNIKPYIYNPFSFSFGNEWMQIFALPRKIYYEDGYLFIRPINGKTQLILSEKITLITNVKICQPGYIYYCDKKPSGIYKLQIRYDDYDLWINYSVKYIKDNEEKKIDINKYYRLSTEDYINREQAKEIYISKFYYDSLWFNKSNTGKDGYFYENFDKCLTPKIKIPFLPKISTRKSFTNSGITRSGLYIVFNKNNTIHRLSFDENLYKKMQENKLVENTFSVKNIFK